MSTRTPAAGNFVRASTTSTSTSPVSASTRTYDPKPQYRFAFRWKTRHSGTFFEKCCDFWTLLTVSNVLFKGLRRLSKTLSIVTKPRDSSPTTISNTNGILNIDTCGWTLTLASIESARWCRSALSSDCRGVSNFEFFDPCERSNGRTRRSSSGLCVLCVS